MVPSSACRCRTGEASARVPPAILCYGSEFDPADNGPPTAVRNVGCAALDAVRLVHNPRRA